MPQPEPSTARALDARLIADAHLSADDGVVLHHHTAREARLRGHHHVPPDAAIVPHVHHVVELGAFADQGDAQRRAVHAGIGADFYEVADLYAAHLREFVLAIVLEDVAETVCADDAPECRMTPRPISTLS